MTLVAALGYGCAETGSFGGPRYGDTEGAVVSESDRLGRIVAIDRIQVDDEYRLGIGTAIGAVAGGLLGRQFGSGGGRTAATVAGAAVGAAAGTVAEAKIKGRDAQRVTVRMETGGQVTIMQPIDDRLAQGMSVRVEGSGETARVVPY
jgi:outer membrane lipoprotein SlyB